MSERKVPNKYADAYGDLKIIRAGVPQGSELGPLICLLFTKDVPNILNITKEKIANDTVLLVIGNSAIEATIVPQKAVNKIATSTFKYRMN